MKWISALLLLSIASMANCQDVPHAAMVGDVRRVQIGVCFSPDVCYRKLEPISSDDSKYADYRLRQDYETPKFGYTTGAIISIKITNHLSIETGGLYAAKGYQTKPAPFTGSTGPPAPVSQKSVYDFRFLDVPLKVSYRIGAKRLRYFASVGMAANLILKMKQTSSFQYPNNSTYIIEKTYEFSGREHSFSTLFSLGVDYAMHDRIHLRIEPIFRYAMQSIQIFPIQDYLYSTGLNVGVNFGL